MRTETSLYGAAMVGERLLGLLLLPLLTRQVSPSDYGLWTQTAVVSNLLMPVALMGVPTALARYLAGGIAAAARRRLMLQALAGVLATLALLAALAGAFQGTVAQWAFGSASQRGFVVILLMVLAADALVDLLTAFWRAASNLRSVSALVLLRASLRCGLMLLALVLLRWSFEQAFLALALLQLALITAVFVQQAVAGLAAAPGTAGGEAPRWAQLLRFGAPLALASVLGAAHAYADRLVLAQELGLAPLASYAAAASLVSVAAMGYSVLGFTLFPELARRWGAGDAAGAGDLARRALQVFWFLALPVVVCLAGVGDTLLPLLTTVHYQVEPGVWLLLGVALLAFGSYQIALYLLLLEDRGYTAASMLALAGAVNLSLNLALIPSLGLLGAAAAAAASNLLLAALALRAVHALLPATRLVHDAAQLLARAALAGAVLLAVRALGGGSGWSAAVLPLAAALAAYSAADLASNPSLLRAGWRGAA